MSETNTPAPAPAPIPTPPASPEVADYTETYTAGPEQIRMWSVSKVLEFNGLMGQMARGTAGIIQAASELEDYVMNGKPAAPAAA